MQQQEIILSEDKKYEGYYSIITQLEGITFSTGTVYKMEQIEKIKRFKVTAIYDQRGNCQII
jgi:hypothetical protein